MPTPALSFDRLVLDEVSRHFGRRRALSRVSLTFEAGQVVGLLGPNGAGKSTLLSILATLLTPSSGEVRYGSQTARQAGPPLRGAIGLLAHDLYLYPELTARENLRFFGQLYGVSDPEGRVERALARARLSDRADEPVAGFSRGMRQRLALERTLLHDPQLLLLDEPFTGLDDASTSALLERLGGLAANRAIVVLATHDLDIVEPLLHRTALFRDGRLVAVEDARGAIRASYRAHLRGAPEQDPSEPGPKRPASVPEQGPPELGPKRPASVPGATRRGD